MTTSASRGRSSCRFFRLWVRAPRMRMLSLKNFPVKKVKLATIACFAFPPIRLPSSDLPSPMPAERMSPLELRAGASLAGVYGLRMLGLFVILPVFAVHAAGLRGGEDLSLVGVALGAYGLAQGILQIPFGTAS